MAVVKKSLTVTRLLVIDDDTGVRNSMCVFLEDQGYDVVAAETAKLGLQHFRDVKPDVVVCDLRMPDMDGLRVLETITRESPDTPVIVVSGAGMIADVVEALRLGAVDYLVKPIVDLAVLQHAIQSALHKSELEQENLQYKNELEVANNELQQNLDLLRQDHEAGRQAQLQLLPEPHAQFGDYQFAHSIIPSLYLSGDFLDYFEIDARYLGFYIADVSGHGAASAFVTMMLKSLFNQPLRHYRLRGDGIVLAPEKILAYLNHEILQSNLGKYLTLFYGVIDRHNNSLHYANAGHYPRPLLMQDGKRQFLGQGSFPVGLFEWASYTAHQIPLSSSFKLLLVSDGVLEVMALTGTAKKEELLHDLVESDDIELDTLVDRIRARLPGMPPDDIALFQIERLQQ